MNRTIRRPRATVTVGREVTIKTFASLEDYFAELGWYRTVPWAAPELLDQDPAAPSLTIRTLPLAATLPRWRPAQALFELLTALHQDGLHHRDVHVGNIVRGPDGPLLIDLETMIDYRSDISYDLWGPKASGVPVPGIHRDHHPQWWSSKQRLSVKNFWRVDVPAEMA